MLQSRGFIGNPKRAYEIEDLYSSLEADSYIEEIRRPTFGEGRVDIDATTEAAELNLWEVSPRWPSNGYYLSQKAFPPAVAVRMGQSLCQRDLTVGHEIGHHFVRRVRQIELHSYEEEDFCEYFGLQLIIDRPVLGVGQLAMLGDIGD